MDKIKSELLLLCKNWFEPKLHAVFRNMVDISECVDDLELILPILKHYKNRITEFKGDYVNKVKYYMSQINKVGSNVIRPESYLDFGSGDKKFATALAKELKISSFSPYDVVGFEVFTSTEPFELLKKYDLITCNMSLHHVSKLDDTLKTLCNALSENGMLIIREHDAGDDLYKCYLDFIHKLFCVTGGYSDFSKNAPNYTSRTELCSRIKAHGLYPAVSGSLYHALRTYVTIFTKRKKQCIYVMSPSPFFDDVAKLLRNKMNMVVTFDYAIFEMEKNIENKNKEKLLKEYLQTLKGSEIAVIGTGTPSYFYVPSIDYYMYWPDKVSHITGYYNFSPYKYYFEEIKTVRTPYSGLYKIIFTDIGLPGNVSLSRKDREIKSKPDKKEKNKNEVPMVDRSLRYYNIENLKDMENAIDKFLNIPEKLSKKLYDKKLGQNVIVIAPSASGKTHFIETFNKTRHDLKNHGKINSQIKIVDGDDIAIDIYKKQKPEWWRNPKLAKEVNDKVIDAYIEYSDNNHCIIIGCVNMNEKLSKREVIYVIRPKEIYAKNAKIRKEKGVTLQPTDFKEIWKSAQAFRKEARMYYKRIYSNFDVVKELVQPI